MSRDRSLCFSIVGHPNEGKSSVVSTLAEDDSVRISPYPGETKKRQVFPFRLDGKEILRFIDTPGFQRPGAVLEWMKAREKKTSDPALDFLAEFRGAEEFCDEVEVFESIMESSGIIYVADCSKPLRRQDRFEMEILRMTGRPRMAVLNSKEDRGDFISDWKNEFMRNFNSVRIFNAHRALWAERLDMLESLRLMDQAWDHDLSGAVKTLRSDWERRISETALLVMDMLEACLGYSVEEIIPGSSSKAQSGDQSGSKLVDAYRKRIAEIEKKTHASIRSLFRHRVFDVEISDAPSLGADDLFSRSTWRVLGLTPGQLVAAGGAAGASVGAVADIVAHGLTMGAFTAIGALAGVAGAWLKGEDMVSAKAAGMPLGGYRVKVGPCRNIQLMYVLIDRAMIYFSHIVGRPHGLRENARISASLADYKDRQYLSRNWPQVSKRTASFFFEAIKSGKREKIREKSGDMEDILRDMLRCL